ncbi:MAG: UvrD-helicase domain-containing protein [Patescibacteria group bacterium]|nr:UvrD-helicase domain-containing protein [Patescibacteria group bacterium]
MNIIIVASLAFIFLLGICLEKLGKQKEKIKTSPFEFESENMKTAREIKIFLDAELKEKLGFEVELEKAIAIARTDKNLLVSARAGSGKTSLVAYKVFHLIKKDSVRPNSIMVLAFNNKAAKNLKTKIRQDFGLEEFSNARTFHSLTYQLVKPKKEILFDDKMFEFVEKIIRKLVGDNAGATFNAQITELAGLFRQFIQKSQKNEMTFDDIKKLIESNNFSPKMKSFLNLASDVYLNYEKYLIKTNKTDFDHILKKAIKIIEGTRGECFINIGEQKIKMNDLRYLFIDEFQDFSKLFYHLIQTIRKYNKNLKLFCVGDSWQAINSFAGSDLKYFNDFTKYVDNAGTANLLTNYRSKENIVKASNNFMAGQGEPSRCVLNNKGGEIKIVYVKDKNYLDLCSEIIKNNPDKSIAILHRKNEINGISLSDFLGRLKKLLSEEEIKKIEVSTVHGYKGKEADIIIIPQAIKRLFPLIHPYSALFEIFGEIRETISAEEERLFYVAITRAREKLFILTEKNKESNYLNKI